MVAADEGQQIKLDQPVSGNRGAPAAGGESADDLFDAATQAMKNEHYQAAINLLQQVVKLDPKHKARGTTWAALTGDWARQ